MSGDVALLAPCQGEVLLGILHPAADGARRGVVIVVGGPQYRVGSHRQFLLLARDLAAAGVPVLRFDCRGMGDSGGDFPGFTGIDADIGAAIDGLFAQQPGLAEVVLWGLCDAASAIIFYAHRDPRVRGVVLVNPWVRSDAGLARAYLRHYYLGRLAAPDFWRKVWRGEFALVQSLRSLVGQVATAASGAGAGGTMPAEAAAEGSAPLAERMASGLGRFAGRVLVVTSGHDLVAQEFADMAARSRRWRRLLRAPRVERRHLAAADHTFSTAAWRGQVAEWTLAWLRSW